MSIVLKTTVSPVIEPRRRTLARLTFSAVICTAIAILLLLWLVWAFLGRGPAPRSAFSILTFSYAAGLAAVTMQVLSLSIRQRLQEPRPIGPLLSLVLIVPLLVFQTYLVWLYFFHGPVR